MYNPSPRPPASRRTKLTPLKISLAYLLYGVLWIFFSDRLAAGIASSEEQLHIFSNIKGWLFIGITALLLYLVLFRNAKKIKAREQQLARSESHLKAAQTTARVGSWEQDTQTDALIWSDTVYELFGIDPGKTTLSTEQFLTFVHPDDQEPVKAAFLNSLDPAGPSYDISHRIIRPDTGAIRFMHERCTHFRDADEKIIKTIGTVQDITNQVESEERVKTSEALMKRTQAMAHVGSWQLDLKTNVLTWSDEAYRVFGVPPEKFNGTYDAFLETVHPDDREIVNTAYADSIRDGRDEYEIEHRIVWADGTARHVHEKCVHERDAEGTIVRSIGFCHDITERKQSENARDESEEKYRALFDNAPLPYQSLNEDGCFLDVNPAWLRILGYDRGEVIGNWFGDFLHPDFVQHFETNFPAFKKRGYVKDVQFQIRHKNGEYRHIEFEGCIGYLPDGSFRQTYCVFMDITARKVAEEQLVASEERLRMALHAANQGLYDLNVQTGECTVSPEYATMLGYDPATFMETNAAWQERIHPDDMERTAGFYQDYIDGKTDEYRVEFRQRTASGDWLWVLSCGKVVEYDAEGQPLRMLGTHTNINQRKKAEEQLAASEERFRTICEGAPVMIDGFDENGHCTLWNEHCRKTLGWTFEEITAQPNALELFYPDPDVRNEVMKSITNHPDGLFREWQTRTKDGQVLTTVWANLRLANGQVYSIGQDITETRRMEQELANHSADLEHEVDERTHELRQIVNAMAGRENRMAELKEVIESLHAQLQAAGLEPIGEDPGLDREGTP